METPKKEDSKIALIKAEINLQIGDADTLKSLIDTTFTSKGTPMAPALVKRALLEGMLRGFSFQQFLNREVYAIPFADTYSLVTSIDYSRKIAQKCGVWQSEADYKEADGKVVACTVTAFRRIGEDLATYPATVYFSEYTTGKNLWLSKPRTMISKVAEMHALRKACPEELGQAYVEEEMQPIVSTQSRDVSHIDITGYELLLRECQTIEGLELIWADMPGSAKVSLKPVMEEMKAILLTEAKDIV